MLYSNTYIIVMFIPQYFLEFLPGLFDPLVWGAHSVVPSSQETQSFNKHSIDNGDSHFREGESGVEITPYTSQVVHPHLNSKRTPLILQIIHIDYINDWEMKMM